MQPIPNLHGPRIERAVSASRASAASRQSGAASRSEMLLDANERVPALTWESPGLLLVASLVLSKYRTSPQFRPRGIYGPQVLPPTITRQNTRTPT